MLARFVIFFLTGSKRLLTSWLQSPSAVILEPKKIKSVTVSIVSPSICHEGMGPDAMILRKALNQQIFGLNGVVRECASLEMTDGQKYD